MVVLTCCVGIIPAARAQTTVEMNREADLAYRRADAELNRTYQRLLSLLDPEGKAKLESAERAWIAFRDKEAEFDADLFRGGTAATALRINSAAETTRQRTRKLKQAIDNHSH